MSGIGIKGGKIFKKSLSKFLSSLYQGKVIRHNYIGDYLGQQKTQQSHNLNTRNIVKQRS